MRNVGSDFFVDFAVHRIHEASRDDSVQTRIDTTALGFRWDLSGDDKYKRTCVPTNHREETRCYDIGATHSVFFFFLFSFSFLRATH